MSPLMECFEVWLKPNERDSKLYASVTSLNAAKAVARLCRADLAPGETFIVFADHMVDINGDRKGYILD